MAEVQFQKKFFKDHRHTLWEYHGIFLGSEL